MTRFFLPIPFLLLAVCTYSQQLSRVIFSEGKTLSSFSFVTDQQVIIRISEQGEIIEWGTDPGPGRFYSSGKLQPYMGRVEYYEREYDSILTGKIKGIGTCRLTYYGSSEMGEKKGRLKSIGGTVLDYYDNYENPAFKGKIKSAGYVLLEYYSSFENEAFSGKLKSIGNTAITYYSTFEDKLIKGKVKSIGSFTYIWYSSRDGREYQGALKSGSYSQVINGITYKLRDF